MSAAISYLVPQLGAFTALKYGGKEIGDSLSSFAKIFGSTSQALNEVAAMAGLTAGFERRREGWQHQADLADYELRELEKQVKATEIRLEIANKTMDLHDESMEQLNEVYEFYKDKFSNLGLYTWFSTSLQTLFKAAYNNAYAMAKLAERAYRFERGDNVAELIGPSHWDASRAGLLAGERLLIDLQNLERRFIETNYRSLEIDQSFSLTQIAPDALIQLKETGECSFSVPEIFFNLFYPGHYKRKIKAVRLTIPCITGPYTNVSAILALKDSQIRMEPKIDVALRQVPRSRTVAIATSTAQNDAGVFELNFRDERYMPFEGAGAVSTWELSLPKSFRQFDYQTINDVILHISYTAEEDANLRNQVEQSNGETQGVIQAFLRDEGLHRIISLRQEFSHEFSRLLHSAVDTAVPLRITDTHFPIFLKGESITLRDAVLILRTSEDVTGDEGEPGGEREPESETKPKVEIKINGTSINGTPPENFQQNADKWGGLPYRDVATVFAGRILGEHTIAVSNAGPLAPSPHPGDVSAIDSAKLEDIYVYLRYGLPTGPS